MATLQQAHAAKARALILLGDVVELNGVGISGRDENYLLHVHLVSAPTRPLPPEIDGVLIKYKVVGHITPLLDGEV